METEEPAITRESIYREQFYRTCQDIVQQIMNSDNSFYFFKPVDPELDGAPNYYEIILTPMSIFVVQDKLDKKLYNTPEEFIQDMRQIWINAKQYNHQTHTIYKAADLLAQKFEILASSLPRSIPPGSQSSALQRLVELRFLRYRLNKTTHQ
ncbi:Bromodomain containing protein [Histomonas meleagridis]|uniref:Bromodomain containing protein n=1 Tax=Histomonas meleagridis TaxID=135588 RepID=UPI00355A4F7D|nr:Bromodomain containing protein [Histomonas meleagridis]KAH0797155.1 Bromodomain containing protein [Histomonas meleagridis]KAH0797610.1 Bromodomain containing protein [Histomonas meleagridis]